MKTRTLVALVLLAPCLPAVSAAADPPYLGTDLAAVAAAEIVLETPVAGPEAPADLDSALDPAAGEAVPLGSGCFAAYCECELGCRDLTGPAHTTCANQCYAEFQACQGG
jgi:hypothetical protein